MTVTAPDPIAPPPPASRVSILISWIIVLASVLTLAIANRVSPGRRAVARAADDAQIMVLAKYAVGANAIARSMGGEMPPETASELDGAVQRLATTPSGRLHAVAVIGELEGSTSALAELQDLEPDWNDATLRADAAALRTMYSAGAASLAASARDGLLSRHGWFARLALGSGPGGDAVLHRQAVAAGMRVVVAMFSMLLGGTLAIVGGTALLTLAIVRLVDAKVRLAYAPPRRSAVPFLESFALYLGGMVTIGLLVRWLLHGRPFLSSWIALGWVPVAFLWPLLRGVSWTELRQGLGWHTGRGVAHEVGVGALGYLGMLPIAVAGVLLTTLLSYLARTNPVHPIITEFGGGWRSAVQLYLLACVYAPIVEETMFRGALFHHLRRCHGWLVSAVVSGILFAALHPQGWTAIPLLGAMGMVFCAVREWRGTVLASGTTHAINNAVAVTLMLVLFG